VDALFVTACGVVGAVVGGLLDPVGQQAAEWSHAAEERDRAERAARRAERAPVGTPDVEAAASTGTPGPGPVPELAPEGPVTVPELTTDAPPGVAPASADGAPGAPGDEAIPVRHLLPSGRSPGRTVGAALVTGGLWAAVAHQFGSHLVTAPFLVFEALAVVVSVTDLSWRLVPRHLIYGALALIVPLLVASSAVGHHWSHLVAAAIWGAVAFALFFLVWFFVPRGMGFGDVRLAGVIGLTTGYLGPVHVYLAFLCGFVLGLLFGVVLMAVSSAGRKTRIPFAPALVLGATVAVLWGGTLGQHLFHAGS
jgi:leader peptidase (prepilin peptidase)/N-methyltransferase